MSLRLMIESSLGVALVFFVLLVAQRTEEQRLYEQAVEGTQTRVAGTLSAQADEATQAAIALRTTARAYDARLDEQAQRLTPLVAQNTRSAQTAQSGAATATQAALQVTQTAQRQHASATQSANTYAAALRQQAATGTQAAIAAQATQAEIEVDGTTAAQDAAASATQFAFVLADVVATSTEHAIEAQATQAAFSTAVMRQANSTTTASAREVAHFVATGTRAARDARSTQSVAQGHALSTQNALIATQTQQAIAFADLAAEASAVVRIVTATPLPTSIPATTLTPPAPPSGDLARYATQSIEIYLPDDYINLDADDDMTTLRNVAAEMGPDYLPFIEAVQANPDLFVLYGVRRQLNDDYTIDNFNIINEHLLVEMPLTDYVSITYQTLPDNVEMVSQEKISLDGQDVARTVLRNHTPTQTVQQVQYIFQGADKQYWILTYTTGEQYFEERLPMFEASARTFRVLPNP